MGWLTRYRGGEDMVAWLTRGLCPGVELVASSTCGGVAYLALRVPSGEVTAAIVLTEPQGPGMTATKWMSETEHPFQYAPSLRVLGALTPTTDRHALDWRAGCIRRRDKARGTVPKAPAAALTLWPQ